MPVPNTPPNDSNVGDPIPPSCSPSKIPGLGVTQFGEIVMSDGPERLQRDRLRQLGEKLDVLTGPDRSPEEAEANVFKLIRSAYESNTEGLNRPSGDGSLEEAFHMSSSDKYIDFNPSEEKIRKYKEAEEYEREQLKKRSRNPIRTSRRMHKEESQSESPSTINTRGGANGSKKRSRTSGASGTQRKRLRTAEPDSVDHEYNKLSRRHGFTYSQSSRDLEPASASTSAHSASQGSTTVKTLVPDTKKGLAGVNSKSSGKGRKRA